MVFRELSERRLIDRFSRADAMRAAVFRNDGYEFGLFEGVEGGFAVVAGFEGVGEEELIVAEGGGGGEGFDEEPGLFGGPVAGGTVDVED